MPGAARPLALLLFCAATVVLVPVERYLAGGALWLGSLALVLRDADACYRRRMAVLLGCVAVLAAAPIHTDTSNRHFLTLGLPFLAVVAGPALLLRRGETGPVRFRLWPARLELRDLLYVAISIPGAWIVLKAYFTVDPWLPTHWSLPPQHDPSAVLRLFVGINLVGIWDELFFVNTVYAVLRSLFPYRLANAAQAVVYTAVLYDMAFTGIGPLVVYAFAWTQGAMCEKSESLVYVLIVHLVVDAFLVAAIVSRTYPGVPLLFH